MTSFFNTSRISPLHPLFRCLAMVSLVGGVAACGSGGAEVRNGPQAVHPSPSRLASGVVAPHATSKARLTSIQQITIINVTAPCAAHKACHNGRHDSHKYDGSRPIVD